MLLSRALNRGYGMSRYRWPMHFGLLNNDCLWVMDETQLMANGVATSIQLDGFRSLLWPVAKPCITWWMTATAPTGAFSTTDRVELHVPEPESFPPSSEQDLIRNDPLARDRWLASKGIKVLAKAPKNGESILKQHQQASLTLVFLNTVDEARIWQAMIKTATIQPQKGKRKTAPSPSPEVLLVHGRFRPADREAILLRMQQFCEAQSRVALKVDDPGLIVVTTQVLEAGVDISAARLWSQIGPWASVIQRLGRLNRDGKLDGNAEAFFWEPKPADENKDKDSPNSGCVGPYEKSEIVAAKGLLGELESRLKRGEGYRDALETVMASDAALEALKWPNSVVIRPDDVHGLFPTEPDLAGGFTNVAPFVRSEDADADVAVYYREFRGTPSDADAEPDSKELVAVPSHVFRNFLEKAKCRALLWNDDTEQWARVCPADVVPGMRLLLPVAAGGYSDSEGWTGDPGDMPTPFSRETRALQKLFADPETAAAWQPLPKHTTSVETAAEFLADRLTLVIWRQALVNAARWHDVGKAHPRWQAAIPNPAQAPRANELWAKFPHEGNFRPGTRHEALSLLAAWNARDGGDSSVAALVLFLVAAHHGKVRTLLRSSDGADDLFGWKAADEALSLAGQRPVVVDLARRAIAGTGKLDWNAMEYLVVSPSWSALMDELLGPPWRDDPITSNAVPSTEPRNLRPFVVAYLEAVFRAADARASRGGFNARHT